MTILTFWLFFDEKKPWDLRDKEVVCFTQLALYHLNFNPYKIKSCEMAKEIVTMEGVSKELKTKVISLSKWLFGQAKSLSFNLEEKSNIIKNKCAFERKRWSIMVLCWFLDWNVR